MIEMAVCDKMSRLLSQFRGTLVGAVVGDCLGASFEGQQVSLEEVLQFFSVLKGTTSKQSLHAYTDDTAMTHCVARSLIEQGVSARDISGFNSQDMAKKFVTEFYHQPLRGYGRNIGVVFDILHSENFKDVFEPAKKQFGGRGSYGNGGAMRISPAALFTYGMCLQDCKSVDALVTDITRITHYNQDAITGAVLQCAAIQTALTIEPNALILKEELSQNSNVAGTFATDFVRKLKDRIHCDSCNPAEASSPYCDKLHFIDKFIKSADPVSQDQVQQFLGNDISALGSVPAAVYSFLHCVQPVSDLPEKEPCTPLERTVMYAVSLGGDTDTIASMAGAIAGAYYGLDGVPEKWQEICEGVSEAIDYADQLHKLLDK